MLKKILLTTLVCLVIAISGLAFYQYNDFETSKPVNEWCDIKLKSMGPGINTMIFIKFSIFDKKLDPQVVYNINGKDVILQSFGTIKLPPTYQFSNLLQKSSFNYTNTMVVNIPAEIASQLKKATVVKVIFFSNGTPIPCNVPESIVKEWKNTLR